MAALEWRLGCCCSLRSEVDPMACVRGAATRQALPLSSLLLMFLMIGTAAPAAGQAVYGSISGTITDNTGAVLPGVTVTITSLERKTTDDVATNESGFYVKDRLLPGVYE